jgi:hypothetical protein
VDRRALGSLEFEEIIMCKSLIQPLGVLATLALLICVVGCASDKPKAAPAPAAAAAPTPPPEPVSLSKIKSEILSAKAQLDTTNNSLVALQNSSTTDAQANYNKFSEEYLKLKSKGDAVGARANDLKEKSAAYYALWNKQVEVQNPELRRQAIQQKADAEGTFSSIRREMDLSRLAFDPYMANLKDVGNYLRGNVSPANLKSVSDLVTQSTGHAKEVNTHLDALVTSIDKMIAATGETSGAAAPATPAAAPAAAPAAGTPK